MKEWKTIRAEEIGATPFQLVGKDWMLVTAKKSDGSVNTMTASWGGMGVMWGKNVAYVVLRPQRYTKEFVDESGYLTLSFFADSYKKQLSYLGHVSGREENKIEKSDLKLATDGAYAYFDEARLVLKCKVLFAQPMEKGFLDPEIEPEFYANGDYHTLYLAEIEQVLAE